MNIHKRIIFILILISSFSLHAQKDTLSYAEQFEQLAMEMDSLSIFSIIDSILSAEPVKYSELGIRAGYTSNVLTAGRNYGINQHGLSPGLSFYHKSGFFTDVTGYWNSAFDPKYNLTLFSLGYFGTVKNFSFTPSYEKWFYNNDTTATLSNSLGLFLSQDIKFLNVGVDYSYLFGQESAHRLIGSVSGYFTLKKVWIFDRISFMPSVSTLFGNDEVTQVRFTESNVTRPRLNEAYTISQQSEQEQSDWISQSLREEKITRFAARYYWNNLQEYGTVLTPEQIENIESTFSTTENENVFGLMNWSFSLPIFFTINQFSFSLTYSYNIPIALPGEVFDFDPISYFGASIGYRIPFRK